MTGQLMLEVHEGMACITLSRSDCRNALSRALLAELRQTLQSIRTTVVHAIVLTGANSCFSAGADFRELDGGLADEGFDEAVASAVEAVRSAPIPVIAAIEGPCIGAALDLALACDLRVVADTAFLELPAIRLGLLYNPSALARMGAQLSSTTLTRLLLLGERFDGREAVSSGIASHAAGSGEALKKARELAARFQMLPKQAVETNKRFLVALDRPLPDLDAWQAERLRLLNSPERREAVAKSRARHAV